jgi:hypothetical protein
MLFQKVLIIVYLLVVSYHICYSQEMGWIKAQAIRDNVVAIKSNYGVGFGFIVAEKTTFYT